MVPVVAVPSGAGPAGQAEGVRIPPRLDLVPFDGQVQHIFFHPLVIYPALAFHGNSLSRGYRNWFITVKEFERILPQLYANGYILINVHDLYSVQSVNGKIEIHRNVLMVPRGKKPLILSIDDLNYYRYMREDGNGYKLVLDNKGRVAVYAVDPSGRQVVSLDDGIIPILDRFVAAHPDFSLDGAKGIINLTGYQGVLGYRTEPGSPDRQAEIQQALQVIDRLKEEGWIFACHSWGHRNDAKISYASLVADTQRWLTQVEPLVGPTDLYVYPFGAAVKPDSRKMAYLISQGFHVFFGVGPHPNWRWRQDYVAMDRVHVDGLALTTEKRMLAPFFNADTVLDRQGRGLP